jgi:site-specific DNA recombinase
MKTRAGIYVRISQDREGQGLGVQRQEDDCRALARRRHWTVVEPIYSDNDVSAMGHRREWRRLLGDLKAGNLDAVVAYSSSRMYRHLRDLTELIDIVDEQRPGTQIATVVSGNIDLTTADGRMLARIIASTDQREWEATSERWKAQKRHAIAAGRYTGGGPVFGYDPGPVVNPEQAALIHDVVVRVGQGVSLSRICLDWNAAGVTTVGGLRWRPSNLKRLLQSEHVRGGRGFPAIITAREAAILDARLGSLPKAKVGRPRGTRRFPLARLVHCAECGQPMSSGAGYYRCSLSHGGCGRVTIKATPLERYLLGEVADRWVEQAALVPLHDLSAVEELLSELHRVEAEIKELAEDVDLPLSVVRPRSARLEERRSALAEELSRTLPPATPEPAIEIFGPDLIWGGPGFATPVDPTFQDRWDARELTDVEVLQLRDLYAARIKRVTVKPRARRGHSFDPSRIAVTYR